MPTSAKPCPFCSSEDIRFDKHVVGDDSPTGLIYSMCCYNCGATFPNRYRLELLVEAWNRRIDNVHISKAIIPKS